MDAEVSDIIEALVDEPKLMLSRIDKVGYPLSYMLAYKSPTDIEARYLPGDGTLAHIPEGETIYIVADTTFGMLKIKRRETLEC